MKKHSLSILAFAAVLICLAGKTYAQVVIYNPYPAMQYAYMTQHINGLIMKQVIKNANSQSGNNKKQSSASSSASVRNTPAAEDSSFKLDFEGSKNRIVPALLAGNMKTQQEKTDFIFFAEKGIDAVEAKLREGNRPLRNIPEISTMLIRNAFFVYYGQEFTERQRAGVLSLFVDYYKKDSDFQRLSDQDMQKLYELNAITLILMASEYDAKTKTFSEKAKHLAKKAAETNLGSPIDKFKLTPDGIDFK
ncbi:MAG: hypothetical protein M3525_04195 [Acidobacteriota bacterium]|jgi:hypothetical protein|nr:hypothetical protein [Acidobacteriota bacterium]